MINSLRNQYFDYKIEKEVKILLSIPSIDRKMAQILFSNGIQNIEDFISMDVIKLAHLLLLGLSYENHVLK